MALHTTPDSYTKLLIHSDTSDGSTSIIDSSASGHTITVNGNTHHETDQAKFGASSIYFDGTGDFLSIADHSDLDFNTHTHFTIDFWCLTADSGTSDPTDMGMFNKGTNLWMFTGNSGVDMGDTVLFRTDTNLNIDVVATRATVLTDGNWKHVAAVREADKISVYIDGNLLGTDSSWTITDNSSAFEIGKALTYPYFTGYIDEFRVSTVARWTDSFVPPNKPYSVIDDDFVTDVAGIEDVGLGITKLNSPIIIKSDPDEASTDSVFSVSAKDGTELLDVSADGNVTVNANDDGAIIIGSTARDDHAYFQNIHLTDTTTYDMYGFVNRHKSTGGAKNDTDHLVGITNSVEADNTAGFFGNIIGIQNTATLTNMVNSQGNNLYGMFNELVTQNNGNNDLRNIYGSYWLIDVNGKEIDTGVYGSYIDIDIESEATVGGNSYGQFIQMDDDAGDNNTLGIYLSLLSGVQWGYYQDEGGSATIKFSGGGNGYWDGTADNGAADYAEYFESSGSSVIPIGNTVVLENGKIRQANAGETPIGIVRPHDGCAVVGNSAWSKWQEKYLRDDYGAKIFESSTKTKWSEEITFEAYISGSLNSFDKTGGSEGGIITDDKVEPNGSESVKYYREYKHYTDRIPSGSTVPGDAVVFDSGQRQRLNPDYDPDREYEPREERDEWHIVGLLGQIPITKGQPTGSSWIKMKDVSDTVEMYFVK